MSRGIDASMKAADEQTGNVLTGQTHHLPVLLTRSHHCRRPCVYNVSRCRDLSFKLPAEDGVPVPEMQTHKVSVFAACRWLRLYEACFEHYPSMWAHLTEPVGGPEAARLCKSWVPGSLL